MNLKNVVEQIFKENKESADNMIRSAANAEAYFEQFYEGRFLFELLQNARDAIRAKGPDSWGKVKAWVTDNAFFIANDGIPLDQEALNGICHIGLSTKHDADFIGHKGLGFKSVMEITDTPEIATGAGTVFFDRSKTANLIGLKSKETPLLFFPHFKKDNISSTYPELHEEGYSIVMKFPFRQSGMKRRVQEAFKSVSAQEILFLGNLAEVSFGEKTFEVSKDQDKSGLEVEVTVNNIPKSFIQFDFETEIDEETYASLDPKEQELFESSKVINNKALIPLSDEGEYSRPKKAHLFLFYRTEVDSGLGFYFHSYFSVTPDRKSLRRRSNLNKLIIRRFSEWYATDFLEEIKVRFPNKFLEILQFTRKEDDHSIKSLHDLLRTAIRKVDLIWDQEEKKFIGRDQVLILTKEYASVFRSEILNERKCIFFDHYPMRNWLEKEYGVSAITEFHIKKGIEALCESKTDEPHFFETLYRSIKKADINLSRNRILLTEHGDLVSGASSEVYYGGRDQTIPKVLQEQISFLHPKITLESVRYKDDPIGVLRYERENLLSACLKIFKVLDLEEQEAIEQGVAIIRFLVLEIGIKEADEIKTRIGIPISGANVWLNPFQDPIYLPGTLDGFEFETFNEVDLDLLGISDGLSDEVQLKWDRFWKTANIRSAPSIYIITKHQIPDLDWQKSLAKSERNLAGTVRLINNRQIHLPKVINEDFSDIVISNWDEYRKFITDSGIFELKYYNSYLNHHSFNSNSTCVHVTSFFANLWENKWVNVPNRDSLQLPASLVAIDEESYGKREYQGFKKYLNLKPLNYHENQNFLSDFWVYHVQHPSKDSLFKTLKWVAKEYTDLSKISDRTSFIRFYNKLLSECFNYSDGNQARKNQIVDGIKEINLLGKSIIDETLEWHKGENLLLIDDLLLLDSLEESVKNSFSTPFAFTKRDRNEFGKLAREIGSELSKLVSQVVVSNPSETIQLREQIPFLPFIIALLEFEIGRQLTHEQVNEIALSTFELHSLLEVQISVAKNSNRLTKFFFNVSTTSLAVGNEILEPQNQFHLAKGLQAFLENHLDRELRNFDAVIDLLLNNKGIVDAEEFLIKRDVDPERLEQLKELIEVGDREEEKPLEEDIETPQKKSNKPSSVTPKPPVNRKTVRQETEEQEIENPFEELLDAFGDWDEFDEVVSNFADKEADIEDNNSGSRGRGGGFRGGKELTNRSKQHVGFIGEHLIWRGLINKNFSLLQSLGIDLDTEFDANWFNHKRLSNFDLPDQSTGKGCDILIEPLDLHLEVKAKTGLNPAVFFTGPEVNKMKKKGDSYYLIMIYNLLSEDSPRIVKVIKNPYLKILSGEIDILEMKALDHLAPELENRDII